MTTKSRSHVGLSLVLALAVGGLTVLPASAAAQGATSDPTAAVYGDDDGAVGFGRSRRQRRHRGCSGAGAPGAASRVGFPARSDRFPSPAWT